MGLHRARVYHSPDFVTKLYLEENCIRYEVAEIYGIVLTSYSLISLSLTSLNKEETMREVLREIWKLHVSTWNILAELMSGLIEFMDEWDVAILTFLHAFLFVWWHYGWTDAIPFGYATIALFVGGIFLGTRSGKYMIKHK
jgi:hypothetical protein